MIQKVKKNFQTLISRKIHKKDFSLEESDSSNLLLSLMKRIEDVIILKFASLEKNLLPNKRLAQSHFHSFLESLS